MNGKDLSLLSSKERITNLSLIIISISLIPAFLATLYRSSKLGWGDSLYIHVALIFAIFTFTIFREKIPFKIKSVVIISVCYIIGMVDLLTWGLSSSATIFLIIGSIFVTMMYGFKNGVIAGIIAALIISISGFLIANDLISINIDYNYYNFSVEGWLSLSVDFLSFGVVAIGMVGILYKMFLVNIEELSLKTKNLESALSEVNKLKSFIPICSHCKKIRNDEGYWEQIESYISEQTGTQFSHSICKDCMEEHYPE